MPPADAGGGARLRPLPPDARAEARFAAAPPSAADPRPPPPPPPQPQQPPPHERTLRRRAPPRGASAAAPPPSREARALGVAFAAGDSLLDRLLRPASETFLAEAAAPARPLGPAAARAAKGGPLSVAEQRRRGGRHPDGVKRYAVVPTLPDGSPRMPVVVGLLQVRCLGRVESVRPRFHSKRYIWPIGYRSQRTYRSMRNPDRKVVYTCEIADGGDAPLFVVTPADGPPVRAISATAAWYDIVNVVNQQKSAQLGRRVFTIPSGPEMYGFSHPTIVHLIQQLPGARNCSRYQFQHFEVQRGRRPHAALDTAAAEAAAAAAATAAVASSSVAAAADDVDATEDEFSDAEGGRFDDDDPNADAETDSAEDMDDDEEDHNEDDNDDAEDDDDDDGDDDDEEEEEEVDEEVGEEEDAKEVIEEEEEKEGHAGSYGTDGEDDIVVADDLGLDPDYSPRRKRGRPPKRTRHV